MVKKEPNETRRDRKRTRGEPKDDETETDPAKMSIPNLQRKVLLAELDFFGKASKVVDQFGEFLTMADTVLNEANEKVQLCVNFTPVVELNDSG